MGAYGQQKIKTPHLDEMAKEGIKFTNHYSSTPVCAPARCMLLTGMHGGHAYIRGNHELGGFEDSNERGQMPLPGSAYTIADMMKEAGYVTGMVGKWGPVSYTHLDVYKRQALRDVYHQKIVPSGPLPLQAKFSRNKVVIRFQYAQGLHASGTTALRGFSVDGLQPAPAKIKGRFIEISTLTKPVFVYYAWQPFTDENLVNAVHLHASTFKLTVQ